MNKRKYILRIVLVAIGLVIVGLISFPIWGLWIITDGQIPSEQDAISIKNDVLKFYSDNKNKFKYPSSLEKLNPKGVWIDENGVLVIFQTGFVDKYGYYYCNGLPLEDRKKYCRAKISDGIYFYHDPG